jgi:hypothetical protein
MRFDLDLHLKVKLRPKTYRNSYIFKKSFSPEPQVPETKKTVLNSIRGPPSSLFEATSCD